MKDYTSGALDGYDEGGHGGPAGRPPRGRPASELEEALEAMRALCEPVEPPQEHAAYHRYFCAAEPGNAEQLKANEPKRLALYKSVAAFVRAYANLANEMTGGRLHRRRGRRRSRRRWPTTRTSATR